MSKTIKIIAKVLLGIGLLFLIPNSIHIYKNIALKFEKLPTEYKDYTLIGKVDSLFTKSPLKVTVFKSIYHENVIKLNDSISYLTTHNEDTLEQKKTITWYKINTNGNVIDSLSIYNEHIDDVNSYLVNTKKSYYLNWLTDGDTIKKTINFIKKGTILAKEKARILVDSAEYSFPDYLFDSITNNRIIKNTVYKNGKLFQFFSEDDYISHRSYYHKNTIEYNHKHVFRHYEKTSWNGHTFPSLGLYLNGRKPEHYDGYAYFNFTLKNNTFNIKNPAEFNEGDTFGSISPYIYESDNKNYYIYKEEYHDENTYYLLK